jgi:hypothetical protein
MFTSSNNGNARGAAMNDFSRKTLRSLSRKGIALIGLSCDAAGSSLYVLNDNGTQRIRTFREVLALAA